MAVDVCKICSVPEQFHDLQEEFPTHGYIPGGEIKHCITLHCSNSSDQGRFKGDLCFPCYEFVATGKGHYSKVFLNALEVSSKRESEKLRDEFRVLAEQWRSDTQHLSRISKAILHPAYLRIIGMGKPVVPLLLEELRERPDHWFAALCFTTNTNPVPEGVNSDGAREAWLEWGRVQGLID